MGRWLESRREAEDYRARLVAVVAAAVVAGSRFYLKLLMHAGNGIARHMEFDADRYEAALAGSDQLETTALRLPVLGYGALAW